MGNISLLRYLYLYNIFLLAFTLKLVKVIKVSCRELKNLSISSFILTFTNAYTLTYLCLLFPFPETNLLLTLYFCYDICFLHFPKSISILIDNVHVTICSQVNGFIKNCWLLYPLDCLCSFYGKYNLIKGQLDQKILFHSL